VRLHPNIAIVRRFYHAFISRDTQTLWSIAGEDLSFHVPGRSRWAGEHRGREALLGLFHRFGQAAERSVRIELHDIVGGEDHVVGLHRMTATIGGKSLDLNGTTTFHVADGKIVEVWLGWESQRTFDELWG
jgi:uncharacterized protein